MYQSLFYGGRTKKERVLVSLTLKSLPSVLRALRTPTPTWRRTKVELTSRTVSKVEDSLLGDPTGLPPLPSSNWGCDTKRVTVV